MKIKNVLVLFLLAMMSQTFSFAQNNSGIVIQVGPALFNDNVPKGQAFQIEASYWYDLTPTARKYQSRVLWESSIAHTWTGFGDQYGRDFRELSLSLNSGVNLRNYLWSDLHKYLDVIFQVSGHWFYKRTATSTIPSGMEFVANKTKARIGGNVTIRYTHPLEGDFLSGVGIYLGASAMPQNPLYKPLNGEKFLNDSSPIRYGVHGGLSFVFFGN